MIDLDIQPKPGFMTFWIDILFCQHNTIQGRLSSIFDKQCFRSETELLLLMHRAYEKVRDETETSWLQREPIIVDSVRMAALLHAGPPSSSTVAIRHWNLSGLYMEGQFATKHAV